METKTEMIAVGKEQRKQRNNMWVICVPKRETNANGTGGIKIK